MSIKYAIYARKSSESKEKQALSIEDQLSEAKTYLFKESIKVKRTLSESKSAYKPNKRPQFNKLLELIRSGEINGIITWNPNRLCRNPLEGGQLLQLLQDGTLQEIRCVTGSVYTPTSDHLVLHLEFGMSNQFSRKLSGDVKRGLTHKVKRGEYPMRAPIGYKSKGDVGRKNLVPHRLHSPIIKKVFEMASDGRYPLSYLANWCHEQGLLTQRKKRISKSHMHHILTNPTYYGFFRYRGELHEGNFPPIISKNLFDRVQEALSDRSKSLKPQPKERLLYNGLLRCEECDCSITTTVKTKHYKRTNRTVHYSYNHCTKRKGKCSQQPINTDELESQLINYMDHISLDEEAWQIGLEVLKEKHKEQTTINSKQLNHYQQRYNNCVGMLNKLIDMRMRDELTEEEFKAQKELVRQEQAHAKQFISDAEASIDNWLELAEDFINVAYTAKKIMREGSPTEKRDLILTIGENLFLSDKRVRITLKKPFDGLLIPEYRSDVLALVDYVRNYYSTNYI